MFQLVLKKLREDKGISQAKLAKDLGISQSTVGMWESGKNKPEYNTLLKLASFFQINVGVFLDEKPTSKGVLIPVLGTVVAGIPLEAVEEILGYEEISQEMAFQGEFFALKIKGDSMEPRFLEDDIVIVRKQSDVSSGEIAVILVNGSDATVKKLVKHKDGISLVADNVKYSPMFYTCKEVEALPIMVIGKLVELRRPV